MIAIDDLDLDMAGSSSSSSSSGYESSSSSDVGSESSVAKVVSSWPPRVKTVSPVKSKLQEANQSLVLPEPVQFPTWPLGENELYCHQCRNKSRILKMSCSCGKLFCARCITIRCVVHPFFCFCFFFPSFSSPCLTYLFILVYIGILRADSTMRRSKIITVHIARDVATAPLVAASVEKNTSVAAAAAVSV